MFGYEIIYTLFCGYFLFCFEEHSGGYVTKNRRKKSRKQYKRTKQANFNPFFY